MSNLDSVIEFCEERMEFKPFVAQVNHGVFTTLPNYTAEEWQRQISDVTNRWKQYRELSKRIQSQ